MLLHCGGLFKQNMVRCPTLCNCSEKNAAYWRLAFISSSDIIRSEITIEFLYQAFKQSIIVSCQRYIMIVKVMLSFGKLI